MKHRYILFVNAADDNTEHKSSANAGQYSNLGLLQLMSSLKPHLRDTDIQIAYFDGTVYGNKELGQFIVKNYGSIFALCFSVVTANYKSSLDLAEKAKKLNPEIITIFGNDHFSALYKEVMLNQSNVDFGFYGNDVVEGFTDFIADMVKKTPKDLINYAGLVYRSKTGEIKKNEENPEEYFRLSLVDYSLIDSFSSYPHKQYYIKKQQETYLNELIKDMRCATIDIARGCIKFAGKKENGTPRTTCDFCGIISGSRPIISQSANRAWTILKNAYDQGFNYFYITADDLPSTFDRLIREMAESQPDWYKNLPNHEKPKMFGYARADTFVNKTKTIETLINALGFNHFFIGFDGLSEMSLKVMNKKPMKKGIDNLMEYNKKAIEKMAQERCKITAGIVITHLGITPEIMKENYETLEILVNRHPETFVALDFGPLVPIPGSRSFLYLKNPNYAEETAERYGLNIDKPYLESIKDNYEGADIIDMERLKYDFIRGCCPDIFKEKGIIEKYMGMITQLAKEHGIVVGGGV